MPNGFFKFPLKDTQIKQLRPKCKYFLFFHQTPHIEKLKGTDFENDNSLWDFQPKDTYVQRFLRKIKSILGKLCVNLISPN